MSNCDELTDAQRAANMHQGALKCIDESDKAAGAGDRINELAQLGLALTWELDALAYALDIPDEARLYRAYADNIAQLIRVRLAEMPAASPADAGEGRE
jgi:hypothetical protein